MNIASLFKLCLIVGCAIGLNGSSLWADEGSYRITGVPVGDTLNIRTGPGMNFPVAGELPNGKEGVSITGDAVMNGEAEWVPISYPGGKGWTRTKYLARSGAGGSSSSGSGSSSGTTSITPAPGRKIVKSTLHGLTLSVKLPSDMTDVSVVDEARLSKDGGADRELLKDLVFSFLKSRESSVLMERVSAFSAGQKLTAEEVEGHACLELEMAMASTGSLRKFSGTFLGKPAFAVLVDYEEDFSEAGWRTFAVVTLEPVNGRFYKLAYTFSEDDAGYGMSPQELITSVMLAESGTSSASNGGDRPQGAFSGDIETFYPGRESVEIERKVTFRPGEQPVMLSKDTEDGVSFTTSRVVLNGSWTGKQFKSTTQRVLSTEIPGKGWVDEEIVITMLPFGVLRFESRWPYGDKEVQMRGNLYEE